MTIQNNFPAIKPSLNLDFANTKQLDPRITFARASTARFYDGKTTAKAEENLLLQSQAFDSAPWVAGNIAVTANSAVAPDGTSTAELIYPTTTGVYRGFYQSGTSAYLNTAVAKVFSIYAKASGLSYIFLMDGSNTQQRTWFNISTGTVGTVASNHTASIVDVGNGWYRCIVSTSIAWSASAALSWNLSDTDNSLSVTTSGTSGVLLWGAQLEQRSFATAYTPTTSQPITNYIPVLQTAAAGAPRFDHNPVTGESLGLLIEEQRTNLLLRSEEFDNATWTKSRASITANIAVAPSGNLTADKLVEDTTASNTHLMYYSYSGLTVGTAYTWTIYAKAGERSKIWMSADASVASGYFDLLAGTVIGGSGTINAVGNGWFRCSITSASAINAATQFYVWLVNTGTNTSYTGDGTSGVYIWGAQLEAGAFATSYIPTVQSQVTRAGDSASITGSNFSSWYNPNEGTLYGEAAYFGVSVATTKTLARLASPNNFIDLFAYAVTTGAIGRTDVVLQFEMYTGNTTENAVSKQALALATNNFATVRNAGTVNTDTSGIVPFANSMFIGGGGSGMWPLNGRIQRIAYYPIRVTNTQLQALTS